MYTFFRFHIINGDSELRITKSICVLSDEFHDKRTAKYLMVEGMHLWFHKGKILYIFVPWKFCALLIILIADTCPLWLK